MAGMTIAQGQVRANETDFADLRAAPRFSVMMRAAKLLCESGEYLCIVRDVSETGTKLRLFHEPPPDTHLFLELGNGDRYAMERMWHADGHAGFRFSSSIDVEEFIEERSSHPRRPVRLRVRLPALITSNAQQTSAMVVDVSQHGACVETRRPVAVGKPLSFELEGMPVRYGHVCWRRDNRHGLVFQDTLGLDERARYALDLQPFAAAQAEETEAAGQRAA
jgi:hypothetical protein